MKPEFAEKAISDRPAEHQQEIINVSGVSGLKFWM
jgi:hypothetical protein